MPITLVAAGDQACNIVEKDSGGQTRNIFTLPLPRPDIVTLLRTLLADPEQGSAKTDPVTAERRRDGVVLHVSRANFTIPYAHLFPLILES